MKISKIVTLILPLLMASPASALTVHEWGTFTSFMGSDGEIQEGLHHEDEPLPDFVYGVKNIQENDFLRGITLATNCVPTKIGNGCDNLNFGLTQSLPQNPIRYGVTQKMETPVIYFYGEPETKVNVKIDFPTGIISQYYPKASNYSPLYKDVKSLGPSHFEFDVTLKGKDFIGNTPATVSDSIWNPAREVQANTIEVGQEHEKFIFYRGVADFKPALKVTSSGDSIRLANLHGQEKIKDIFLLHNDGFKGHIKKLDLNTDFKVSPITKSDHDFHAFVEKAKSTIATALINSGLYEDEAKAMVNTWEKSYFHTPGLRVLYVLNNAETERLLPLHISPSPKELVRVIVGRLEIMTDNQEKEFLNILKTTSLNDINREELFGRFYEPKLRRLKQRALFLENNESKTIIEKINNLL